MADVLYLFEPVPMIVLYSMSSYAYIWLKKSQFEYQKNPDAFIAGEDEVALSKKLLKANPFYIGLAIAISSMLMAGLYGLITVGLYCLTVFFWNKINERENNEKEKPSQPI